MFREIIDEISRYLKARQAENLQIKMDAIKHLIVTSPGTSVTSDESEKLKKLIGADLYLKVSQQFDLNNIYISDWDGKDYIVFSVYDNGLYCVDMDRKLYHVTFTPKSQSEITI